jgi:hypothetical protein
MRTMPVISILRNKIIGVSHFLVRADVAAVLILLLLYGVSLSLLFHLPM